MFILVIISILYYTYVPTVQNNLELYLQRTMYLIVLGSESDISFAINIFDIIPTVIYKYINMYIAKEGMSDTHNKILFYYSLVIRSCVLIL